jgi:hypothetical protein
MVREGGSNLMSATDFTMLPGAGGAPGEGGAAGANTGATGDSQTDHAVPQ